MHRLKTVDYVKDQSSLLGKDFRGLKNIILRILCFTIFAFFIKVVDYIVCYCITIMLHLIIDENPVSSDSSSIDNMLAEDGSVDTSSSSALKYVRIVIW